MWQTDVEIKMSVPVDDFTGWHDLRVEVSYSLISDPASE
jgi:hypothetical protein